MSDLLEDVNIEFPNTVTVCHAEIRRLEGLIAEADAALDAKDARIDELEDELDEANDKEGDVGIDDAINALLDECERSGPLKYDVRQSERASRAIVRLHEVVGRNP